MKPFQRTNKLNVTFGLPLVRVFSWMSLLIQVRGYTTSHRFWVLLLNSKVMVLNLRRWKTKNLFKNETLLKEVSYKSSSGWRSGRFGSAAFCHEGAQIECEVSVCSFQLWRIQQLCLKWYINLIYLAKYKVNMKDFL